MNLGQASRDITGVIGLAIISLAAGLIMNRLSHAPLPLMYQSPEERLQAELAKLVEAPTFQSFPVDTIGLAEFRAMAENKRAMILDARSAVFYWNGHVPGAINLARDVFGTDYIRLRATLEKAKDRPVVVYCSGGACHDSKMVAQALTGLGFSQVRIFAGGWDAWTEAGLPAEQQ